MAFCLKVNKMCHLIQRFGNIYVYFIEEVEYIMIFLLEIDHHKNSKL